jgi:hypothetical protein
MPTDQLPTHETDFANPSTVTCSQPLQRTRPCELLGGTVPRGPPVSCLLKAPACIRRESNLRLAPPTRLPRVIIAAGESLAKMSRIRVKNGLVPRRRFWYSLRG